MKNIVVLTGTRADFSKMKSLLKELENSTEFSLHLFVTGMHLLSKYGYTYSEIADLNFSNVYTHINQNPNDSMDIILAKTIMGLSDYVKEISPDMVIIHGDRVEALAGSIVGATNNITVSHIEGGELSGTIDESIRHSISKLSHLHFVSNSTANSRLLRLGEHPENIFVVGSLDIDIMLSDTLPTIEEVYQWYDIVYDHYAILIFHPVTTELDSIYEQAYAVVTSLIEKGVQVVAISPNNDLGADRIFAVYETLKDDKNFKIFPSMRFEYFLTLLKNASFIIGNSSSGIIEAPIYGVPTVNVGSRQNGRSKELSIVNSVCEIGAINDAIEKAMQLDTLPISREFGLGDSAGKFMECLSNEEVWNISKQKIFFGE